MREVRPSEGVGRLPELARSIAGYHGTGKYSAPLVLASAFVAIPSVVLSVALVLVMFADTTLPYDWWQLREAVSRAGTASLYVWEEASPARHAAYEYRYSPLLAWSLTPVVDAGLWAWRLLHVATLAFLPWRLAVAALMFAPFWYDVLHGNVMTFVAISGYLALRGSSWGMSAFVAWSVLVPRPLMAPVLVWLLWKRRGFRMPALIGAAVGLATLSYPGFVAALMSSSRVDSVDNLSPSAWIGWLWVPIGLVAGAWLTSRGRLGWAALACSPYVLPYYLVALVWELGEHKHAHE